MVSVSHSHHVQYLTISPSLDLSGITHTHTNTHFPPKFAEFDVLYFYPGMLSNL